MKKRFGLTLAIALSVLIFASAGPVLAYTVTGDLKAGYTYGSTTSGSLWSVFTSGGGGVGSTNYDYIVVTGANGSMATYSPGEISPSYYTPVTGSSYPGSTSGGATVTIAPDANNDGGYTVTGDGQTITNVSNINVVRAPQPPYTGSVGTTYPGSKNNEIPSTLFTIFGPNIGTTTWTPDGAAAGSTQLPQTDTQTISGSSHGTLYSNVYTGVSLVSLLQSAGVNTNNLNQAVIAVGNDGFQITMSMSQIVSAGDLDMVADETNDPTSLYYNLDGTVSTTDAGGFARTILGNQNQNGQWDQMLEGLEVVPTPVPPGILLLVPGLAGIWAARKRIVQ